MFYLHLSRYQITLILALFTLFNALYNITLPLYIDEAYYWLWSQYPALSYFDHPPMVAWFIKVFTLFSDSVFWIRMSTVFCMSLSAWYIYKITRMVYDEQSAVLAMLLFLLLPATNMGYTIVTPDSPLILFWSIALYHSILAFKEDSWGDYLKAGVAIGMALLSKYTAVLFLGVLGIYLLVRSPKTFLSFKPWIAILVALLVFSPVLIWNAQHEWISFTFQYQHGTGESWVINWKDWFEFFGGQFITYSPVFFAILLWACWSYKAWWNNNGALLLALAFLFPMLFILYKGLWTRMELNWGIIAFIGALPLTAHFLRERNLQKTTWIGIALSILLVLGMKFPLVFGLEGKNNPQNRIFGYKEVAEHIAPMLGKNDRVFADHLTLASILTYYLPQRERVAIPTESRFSQFSYWDEDLDFSNMQGIYVSKDDRIHELENIFKSVKRLPEYYAQKEGFKTRRFFLYQIN